MEIGKYRERAGMTKTQLADTLGVDLSTVCKWESGANKPKADGLLRMADLFHCTIDELFGREPPSSDSA